MRKLLVFACIAVLGAGLGLSVRGPAAGAATQAASAKPKPGRQASAFGKRRVAGPHVMRVSKFGIKSASAPSGARLTYFGGPVISNIKSIDVSYGSGTYISSGHGGASAIPAFTGQLLGSGVMDWLGEYNTNFDGGTQQTIGRGTFGGTYSINPSATNNSANITDSQIQAELVAQITAGHLPTPTADTSYALFFRQGQSICNATGCSLVSGGFCAYHSTFFLGSVMVTYQVMPDLTGISGCGSSSDLGNTTSVLSHELTETITDPGVGLATSNAAPLAWYDTNNGEIGDICNAQQSSFLGTDAVSYVIQEEFSNIANDCITTRSFAVPHAIVSGFDANSLAPNDDGSTGQLTLPFAIDFFGTTYNNLYVNNNGNVTFDGSLYNYTPSALTSYGSPIIAPFWGDVDTAVSGSAIVTYGSGTVDGHTAFGVNWPGVDCFATTGGGLNDFQLLLIDRSDIAPGDFDIEFNYNSIRWDSGQASGGDGSCVGGTSAAAGYTNGSTNSLELAGSFVNGAFRDGGPDSLAAGSQNSSTPGRYIFPIRSGAGGGSVSGTVSDTASPPNPVGGALVSACSTGAGATSCFVGSSGSDGSYAVLGVPAGTYVATVSPPSGSSLDQVTSGPFAVTDSTGSVENFTLSGPTPPPDGTVVTGVGSTVIGGASVPVIYWTASSPISTQACHGGNVTATITVDDQSVGPVSLAEDPSHPGTFNGTLPAVYPLHGVGVVTLSITGCPNPASDGSVGFTIYVDPSGTVVDGDNGNTPVPGATVTLLTSDSATGTFTAVPDGSAVMSPANRANPDVSGATGSFGWDTVPGYYEVQASKTGCGSVTSPAFQVPPPLTTLQLILHCGQAFSITTSSLPGATRGAPYGPVPLIVQGVTPSSSGYTTQVKWAKGTVVAPQVALPKGLKLSSTGVLSGTVSKKSATGLNSVTVKVTETVTTVTGTKKSKVKSTVQATIPLDVS